MSFLSAVGKKNIVITRFGAGQYVNGRWQSGEETTITICANIQPTLNRNDILMLPEGDRTRRGLKLYTTSKLLGSQEGAGKQPDEFTWTDGFVYQIAVVRNYEMGVLDHYEAIAIRKELV